VIDIPRTILGRALEPVTSAVIAPYLDLSPGKCAIADDANAFVVQ